LATILLKNATFLTVPVGLDFFMSYS